MMEREREEQQQQQKKEACDINILTEFVVEECSNVFGTIFLVGVCFLFCVCVCVMCDVCG